ncbi:hypothetical protein H310_06886 [Aphanomyces invadans]|uniref:protein-tyrosine-phosphatase n=1 Tax=Aphanomyces invadans TaxID=157072 RepID=A0A024U511_9STRA|nr:hypothetical protein H310_06886 [Aphanomyces invadans]ETW01325.1 hypothetical protein H310_06886 [Aphanomyces invadans]|eukprot:XP_008870323.1 hypothetical protein H310_06886 [Aphanomyces invadans]
MTAISVVDGVALAVLGDDGSPPHTDGEVWVNCSDDKDNVIRYTRFFADFGPLNLAQTVRFCLRLNVFASTGRVVCFTKRRDRHHTANAAALLALYAVLIRGKGAQEASRPFDSLDLPPFRDAAHGVCTYGISVEDCASAVVKAIQTKLWAIDSFDVAEFERMAMVEHGDMTWMVPGKLLAFSGPLAERYEFAPGKFTLRAQDYSKLFHEMGVSTVGERCDLIGLRTVAGVVRLNEQCYDRKKFVHAGIHHVDLIFPDGSTPTDGILDKFINICERERGAVAVHCKAGLGRTGTVIAAYIIKHYHFTANEAIAWCRLCRPGCIVGPQQYFLAHKQASLWAQPTCSRPPSKSKRPSVARRPRSRQSSD